MKTVRFAAFSILIGLFILVSSCKKETNPAAASQTGSKILVTGQDAGTGLKSTLSEQTTVWISGSDKVGIYSAEARTASGGLGSAIVNAQFTAATSAASSTFTGTMYWGAGSTSHTFYAYYPYSVSAGTDATVVPVSLATAQIQSAANSSAHIGDLDFMVATPVTVTSPDNTEAVGSAVNLNYNHLFTILEFQIKGSETLKAVKLSGSNTLAFSGGTIDITQTTPASGTAYTLASLTGTATQCVVTLTSAATLTATNTDTKVYMVINPGTHTGNSVIGLSTDGTTWKYITKTALAGGFLRGNKYVVSVDAATAADPVDGDGNTYATVLIGTQVWMASNLNTTKYNDGTSIPNETVDATWAALSTGAYCWFNNDAATYQSTYGALYNWFVVDNNASTMVASNGGKNVCPVGWHVPTDTEWSTLTTYLGGQSVAGGKLKETGTTHWYAPNTGATDETSFTAVPGGYRNYNGPCYSIRLAGYWWSSTESSSANAWYRYMDYSNSSVVRGGYEEQHGYSVRCLRD